MTVHLPLLLLGLLLLWFPRQWMRLGKVVSTSHRRSSRSREPWKTRAPGDLRLTWGEFGKVRNYFDLLRAAAGALAITGWHVLEGALTVSEAASRGQARQVLIAKIAIVLIGLLVQTVRYERHRLSFFAPVFYIAGVSVALCGPWAALFAFLFIWAVNPMFGNAEAFLAVYAVVLVVFALLFKDTSRVLAAAAFLVAFLPVLLALMTRRPLVVFTRKAMPSANE